MFIAYNNLSYETDTWKKLILALECSLLHTYAFNSYVASRHVATGRVGSGRVRKMDPIDNSGTT
jgi:hypothetical protein